MKRVVVYATVPMEPYLRMVDGRASRSVVWNGGKIVVGGLEACIQAVDYPTVGTALTALTTYCSSHTAHPTITWTRIWYTTAVAGPIDMVRAVFPPAKVSWNTCGSTIDVVFDNPVHEEVTCDRLNTRICNEIYRVHREGDKFDLDVLKHIE